MGAEVFHALKGKLKDAGHNTNVGDEGGFAPNIASAREALDFILKAVEAAGYRAGEDIVLALDAAATEFFKDGKYHLEGEGAGARFRRRWSAPTRRSVATIPIVSIEDGMAEDDWDGLGAC